MDGKHCPACGKDIGLLAVIRAPLPNIGMRCPHCRAALKYEPGFYSVAALAALAYLGLLFVVVPKLMNYFADPYLSILAAVGVSALLWQPVEILLTLLLRHRATLALKQGGTPPAAPPAPADDTPPPSDD
ncbi:MAG: hypothetical protein K0R03_2424 [Moraxellaceae bacterium]|jgi:hypothetical protein|nr:hypothetical protein [Moraxellaceae bacterium]